MAAGGAFYLKSRISSPRLDSSRGRSGGDGEALEKRTGNNKNAKKATSKKKGGGLKSLQVLTAILLSQMGKMGARDLLALLATVVCISSLYFPYIDSSCCFMLLFHVISPPIADQKVMIIFLNLLYFLQITGFQNCFEQ